MTTLSDSVATTAPPLTPPRRRRGSASRQRRLVGFLMALPAIVLVVTFFLVPLVLTFWISLNDWSLLGQPQFIGIQNYVQALGDSTFGAAMGFTLLYTVIITPVLFLLGLGLAFLVRRRGRASQVFQSIYFMPVCIGFASGAFLWLYLGQPQIGPLLSLLQSLGLANANTNLYTSMWGAMTVVIAMVTWKVVGLQMLLLLSGLQSIPEEVNEAARIDGANAWQLFLRITLPLLRPTLALVLVFSVAGSLLAFDQFYIMTNGGPANSTITAVYQIYRTSFISFRLGYGAALSVLLMIILAIVSAVQLLLLRNTDNN